MAPLLTSFIVASKKKRRHHCAEGNVHWGQPQEGKLVVLLSWLHVHLRLWRIWLWNIYKEQTPGISLISLQKAESDQLGSKLALSKPEGMEGMWVVVSNSTRVELVACLPHGWRPACPLSGAGGPFLPPRPQRGRRGNQASEVGPAPHPPYHSSPPVVEPKLGVVPRTLWVWNLFQRFRSSLILAERRTGLAKG